MKQVGRSAWPVLGPPGMFRWHFVEYFGAKNVQCHMFTNLCDKELNEFVRRRRAKESWINGLYAYGAREHAEYGQGFFSPLSNFIFSHACQPISTNRVRISAIDEIHMNTCNFLSVLWSSTFLTCTGQRAYDSYDILISSIKVSPYTQANLKLKEYFLCSLISRQKYLIF